jgi:hypothetical protein
MTTTTEKLAQQLLSIRGQLLMLNPSADTEACDEALAAHEADKQPVEDERGAFRAYLKECDECAIVPDVGGAFNGGFKAGRASAQAGQN